MASGVLTLTVTLTGGPWLWLWHCGYSGPWLWRATIGAARYFLAWDGKPNWWPYRKLSTLSRWMRALMWLVVKESR